MAAFVLHFPVSAQDYPSIAPSAVFTSPDGEEQQGAEYSGSAPVRARFTSGVSGADGWEAYYEWRFYAEGVAEPYLVRREEDTEYTFTTAGAHTVKLYATFSQGADTLYYTDEYWAGAEPLRITVSESKLEMPNAFSPNGDGINDIYKAKEGYRSIVEFDAAIYSRWGQRLYRWSDPAGGWDGKVDGRDAAQGVYYVLVKAKGADGRRFNIRRDVNLLRGYTEKEAVASDE